MSHIGRRRTFVQSERINESVLDNDFLYVLEQVLDTPIPRQAESIKQKFNGCLRGRLMLASVYKI